MHQRELLSASISNDKEVGLQQIDPGGMLPRFVADQLVWSGLL